MKKLQPLLFAFIILFFTNCEKELYDNSNFPTQKESNYEVKKISFGQLKNNRKAFEKLKDARLKKNPSLQYRGVYNEDYGVFIDTTNIVMIQNENQHSVTLQIVNDDITSSTIENLVLNSKEDGTYTAFILEYDLTNQDLVDLTDGKILTNKSPSSITEIQNTARFNIEGDGANCVEFYTYSVNMCYNANGNTMIDNGELGNGCVGMPFEVQYTVLSIDADCLSGGNGSGGGDDGGSSGSGSVGDGSTSGGGSGGGTASGNTSGTGNTDDPNESNNNGGATNTLTDENGNPIITTPLLDIERTEIKLSNILTPEELLWWNNANANTKNTILNYLNPRVNDGKAWIFVKEAIKALKDGGEVDFVLQVIEDSSFKNNPCVYGVYQEAGKSQTFENYLKNFKGNFSVANLKFSLGIDNNYSTANAVTYPPNNYLVEIKFNPNNLERPRLDVFRTFIHEMIHAEIFRKLLSCSNLPHVNFHNYTEQQFINTLYNLSNNFPGLHDYYLRFEFNTTNPTDSHHELMAQHYIGTIVAALKEFDNNAHSDEFYNTLAWVGLMGDGPIDMNTGLLSNPTIAWTNKPQNERINILNAYFNFTNSVPPCQN